jgi:GxxExxY protein
LDIGEIIIGAAMKVHTELGPGLLESAYEACLAHELKKLSLDVKQQLPIPLIYDGVKLDIGYKMDLLVNDSVVIELKAVEKMLPIHTAQLLSYLKLSGYRVGYLLNFNVVSMRDGIKRVVNGY